MAYAKVLGSKTVDSSPARSSTHPSGRRPFNKYNNERHFRGGRDRPQSQGPTRKPRKLIFQRDPDLPPCPHEAQYEDRDCLRLDCWESERYYHRRAQRQVCRYGEDCKRSLRTCPRVHPLAFFLRRKGIDHAVRHSQDGLEESSKGQEDTLPTGSVESTQSMEE